ncbi:MAG TPA: aspartate/glutamate racemase family protein [Puia sp.]|nr:aspartate/glutamate racemase family protein [Puia sp.]
MKTLGLIGGTTWLSTADYYRIINQQTNQRLGGLNSARMLLYSLNFEEFKPPADPAAWGSIADTLSGIATRLETAGAECIVLCASTPHITADIVQQRISIPIIHIATATAITVKAANIKKVALLGTKYTMEQPFFRDRLAQHDLETIIPPLADREFIHHSIYTELAKGIFSSDTRAKYLEIIDRLIAQGAEGIILGCTEIPLLIKQEDCAVPVFDTTLIHATAAVDFAIN